MIEEIRKLAEDNAYHSDVRGRMSAGIFDLLTTITERDREIEEVRHILLFNHGHKGQYLDDGELQCSECLKDNPKLYDYKRERFHNLAG